MTADALWSYLKDRVSAASQAAGNPQTPVRFGEETHDFALSLNPLEFGRRKRLAEAISAMAGIGPDRLTTEEGSLCLDLIRLGGRTAAEREMIEAIEAVVSGQLRLPILRRLIKVVQEERTQPGGIPVEKTVHATTVIASTANRR
ncbi:MAG: hypothetical protein ONB24_14870 [candidate division KSB1 bacterium]|nr:hypothetical protein [candidate division KSB1 bacterium]